MKVGINTLFLIPGEVGGSETYLRDVLRHAVPRHPAVDWVLFTNDENHDSLAADFGTSPTVRLWPMRVRARNRPARIIREQVQLPLAARRAGVDVLWSPGYTAPAWAPCPQVVSVLDLQYQLFPEDFAPLARLATRLLVPLSVRVARRVITLSGFSRDQILDAFAVPREKVVAIHLAAAPEFGIQLPTAEGRARRAALVPDVPYILCVANTYPHKNVHTLVEAFGRLPDAPGCHLLLVGGARRGEPRVQGALATLPANRGVVRLEGLGRRDLIALYQGAAVFAFPSLYEGFGLPVLEAMSAGVPVVTSGRGPLREIGGDAVCYCDGTAEDLARKLAACLALSPAERDETSRKAMARAALFTWEQTADQTVAVLQAGIR